MSWHYIQVGHERWEYSTKPRTRCPFDAPRGDGGERQQPPRELVDAAAAAGLDIELMLAKAHRPSQGVEDGRCQSCGAEAIRIGFSARRCRTDGMFVEIVERHTFPLRREAKQWVVEQAEVARSARREPVA
jgi:hypothetical protein